MKKINKRFNIEYYLYWTGGAAISQIREDLDAIEKLGATHIDIEEDDCFISVEGYVERLETDDEYDDRLAKDKAHKANVKAHELKQLAELKLKYENN